MWFYVRWREVCTGTVDYDILSLEESNIIKIGEFLFAMQE